MIRTARTPEFARKLKALARKREGVEWVDGEVLRGLEPGLYPAILGAAYSRDGR